MKDKVTVIINDDSDDEILTVYSVNEDGVIVIDDVDDIDITDDSTTKVQSPEDPNKNTGSRCESKTNQPSTSTTDESTSQSTCQDGQVSLSNYVIDSPGQIHSFEDPNVENNSQSTSNTDQTSTSNEKIKLPSTTNDKKNIQLMSMNNENNLSCSSPTSTDQNKLLQSSNDRKNTQSCLSTKNNLSSTPNNGSNLEMLLPIVQNISPQSSKNTQSCLNNKNNLSRAPNNKHSLPKLMSPLPNDQNILPRTSKDSKNTQSCLSNKNNLSPIPNNESSTPTVMSLLPNDQNILPQTSKDSKNTPSCLSNTNNLLPTPNSKSIMPTVISLLPNDQNIVLQISNDRKNIELSSHNKSDLPTSSQDRQVYLSCNSKRTRKQRMSEKRNILKVTIDNSNATVDKTSGKSGRRDSKEDAPTSSTTKISDRNSSHTDTGNGRSQRGNYGQHSTTNQRCSSTESNNSQPHSSGKNSLHTDTVNGMPQRDNYGQHSTTNQRCSSTESNNSQPHSSGKNSLHTDTVNGMPQRDNYGQHSTTNQRCSSTESNNSQPHSSDKNSPHTDTAKGRYWLPQRSNCGQHSATNQKRCSTKSNDDKSHSSHERGRTQSAPCGTNGKRKHENSAAFDRNKTNSHSTKHSSSTHGNTAQPHGSSTHGNTAQPHSSSTHGNTAQPHGSSTHGNTAQPHSSYKRPRTRSTPSTSSASPNLQVSVASNSRQVLSNLQNLNVPDNSVENLSTYSHILFIDLDNWGRFFGLPYPLSPKVFVWGFCGGNYANKRPWSVHFRALVLEKRFFQHPQCGKSKNAADFALCVQAARLDLQLPMHIPFTVLSGDKGFGELKTQLNCSERRIHLVDPHGEDQDVLYATLASIGET